MRRLLVPILSAAMALSLVAATPEGSTEPQYVERSRTLYLRHDPNPDSVCAGATYLADRPGTGEPGCGYIGGSPLDEVFITATGEPLQARSYPSDGSGLPMLVDPDRDLTGTMVIGADGVGAGIVGFDIEVSGSTADEPYVYIGSAEVRADADVYVLRDAVLEFSIDLPDALAGVELTSITLEYVQRGIYANHGYHQKNGESFIVVPYLEEVSA